MRLIVMDTDGRLSPAGTFSFKVHDEYELTREVPHLHRVDPSGRWLASYDAGRRMIQIRDLKTRASALRRFSVRWLGGRIKMFRWLNDSRTLVFLTTRNAYTVRLPDKRHSGTVYATRVFRRQRINKRWSWEDVRAVGNGFAMQVEYYSDRAERTVTKVFMVKPEGRRFARPAAIKLPAGRIDNMSVRSSNRLVLAVKGLERPGLWTYEVDDGNLRLVDQVHCNLNEEETRAEEDMYQCNIASWSPYSRRLTYVQHNGRVVVHGDNEVVARKIESNGLITGLWLNSAEDAVLVSADDEIMVWNIHGKELWRWKAPDDSQVTSVHFAHDGRTVYAAAGKAIYRLADGKAEVLFTAANPPGGPSAGAQDDYIESGDIVFVDNVVPLGAGALAFSVVRHRWVEEFDE